MGKGAVISQSPNQQMTCAQSVTGMPGPRFEL